MAARPLFALNELARGKILIVAAGLAVAGFVFCPVLRGASSRARPIPGTGVILGYGLPRGQTGGPSIDAGKKLFEAKCAACHTIGKGNSVGPDLRGVTSRRTRAWLAALISDPAGLEARKDPDLVKLVAEYHGLVMPALGLSQAEISEVIDYLAAASGEAAGTPSAKPGSQAPTATAAPAQPVPSGSAASGKAFFWGKSGFGRKGPACMTCHDAAGGDPLGGGSLGPDLTRAYAKYGGPGLDGVLASMTFPVMAPLYRRRPLADVERADLVAYFADTAALSPRRAPGAPVILATAGFIVLLALILFATRIRARAVRRSLVRKALAERGQAP